MSGPEVTGTCAPRSLRHGPRRRITTLPLTTWIASSPRQMISTVFDCPRGNPLSGIFTQRPSLPETWEITFHSPAGA